MPAPSSFQVSSSEFEDPQVEFGEYSRLDTVLDEHNIPYVSLSGDQIPRRGPILEAKVQRCSDDTNLGDATRHTGYKPLWVHALIWKANLGRGEASESQSNLAAIIRKRGIHSGAWNELDDCGHIIAYTLGGNMVDINLFPQDMHLNRGWKGNYILWRCLEATMKFFLAFVPEKYRPRVEFQMFLAYTDSEKPNRPNNFVYAVRFLLDDDDSDDEEDKDGNTTKEWVIAKNVINIAAVALQELDNKLASSLAEIKRIISDYNRRRRTADDEKADIYSLYRDLKEILEIVERERKNESARPRPMKPCTSTPRERGLSVWDFVPVVGSLKSLKEGVEDFEDGHTLGGVMNVTVGGVGLVADVLTLGTISTLGRTIGKATLKEGGKLAAGTVGKVITKVVAQEIVETAVMHTLSGFAKAMARNASIETRK